MGGWVKLDVPASAVGLEGRTVSGMAFTLYDGKAWWDKAAQTSATLVETGWCDDRVPTGALLGWDGGDSWLWSEGSGADLGFTGHPYHGRSELHLAPYRAYSGELGRWLNRDPIYEAGGLNLYAYVENQTTRAIDKLGLLLTCQDIKDILSVYSKENFTLMDVAWELEDKYGGHGKRGGALSHCIFHCLIKRAGGEPASAIVAAAHNWLFENPNNPIPACARMADATSPDDIRANRAGRECAKEKGSCVDECRKKYP